MKIRQITCLEADVKEFTLAKDGVLLSQDDPDTGLFILEQGSLSAHIRTAGGRRLRVRKFSPGSLVEELSAYLSDRRRTATNARSMRCWSA